MEGKIDMAARRQVANKLRTQYRRASKADKSKILGNWSGYAGIQGRPSVSMTRASKKCWLCLAAVDR